MQLTAETKIVKTVITKTVLTLDGHEVEMIMNVISNIAGLGPERDVLDNLYSLLYNEGVRETRNPFKEIPFLKPRYTHENE
jgi:hypothetical protein